MELRQFDIKILPRVAIKGQVLDDYVTEFSPQTVIQKLSYPNFAHKEEESSVGTLTVVVEDVAEDPEVCQDPPQIDQYKARKMYMDGARNNLSASVTQGSIF